mgnify:CR=1 FL=1
MPTGLTPTLWAWPRGVDARQQWQAWAHDADAWLKAQGRDVRDAIVVVPVGALLPLVRQAWADAVGGWMPQIDTIAGLMEQHAWRYTPAPAGAWGPAMTLDVVMEPALVLGLIQVESGFRKHAISSVGARGYMQVMPFWTRVIGDGDAGKLFHMQTNLRFGCVILRHYIDRERGDLFMALGRYNGSRGRSPYPDAVFRAQRNWLFAEGSQLPAA